MAKGDYEETSVHMGNVVLEAKKLVKGIIAADNYQENWEISNKTRTLDTAIVLSNLCAICEQTLARVEELERAAQRRTGLPRSATGTETDVLGWK